MAQISLNELSIHHPESFHLPKDDTQDFGDVFYEIVTVLTTENTELDDMKETQEWFSRVLHYNVPNGKRNRGLTTALAYRYMTNEILPKDLKLSYILGWTVEMLQGFFLVCDDLMDSSRIRRGEPCWYKLKDVGLGAINDACFINEGIYALIRKYFQNKDYYVELIDIIHDVSFKTTYGQSLDTRSGLEKKMESYTMERYTAIVKYKTSYYSFYLPVRLAMAMVGLNDPELIRQVKTVTLEMGHIYQVQDDFLDSFGDESITGKTGTDIQDCKCSWLFIIAMKQVTPEQKQILVNNYGKNSEDNINRVKNLYRALEIPKYYVQYEQETFQTITTHIQQMSSALPKKLFIEMLNMIYQRNR